MAGHEGQEGRRPHLGILGLFLTVCSEMTQVVYKGIYMVPEIKPNQDGHK